MVLIAMRRALSASSLSRRWLSSSSSYSSSSTSNDAQTQRSGSSMTGALASFVSSHLPQQQTSELVRSSPEFLCATEEIQALQAEIELAQSQTADAQADAEAAKRELAEAKAARDAVHPVFGKLVADLGYKRVYAMNPAMVCDPQKFPIWEFQRSFRRDRAIEIANFKQKDQRFGFPGTIVGYEVEGAQEKADKRTVTAQIRGVLDGQHRIGGLQELLQRGAWPVEKPVLVEIFPVTSTDDAKDLFLEINQAQPVQAMDLPGGSDGGAKNAINAACDALHEKYKPMFSSSMRCRPPHLHLDNLRQTIHDNELCDILGDNENGGAPLDGDALLKWLEDTNSKFGSRSDKEWKKIGGSGPAFAKAIKKARKFDFYLGLVPDEWVRA